jgi:outer membrane protein TolC
MTIRCVALAAACLLGAPLARAGVPPSPAAGQGTTAAASALSLSQAVALALQHSPDLVAAEAQRRVGVGEVGTARAQFGPNLYTGTGAIYTYGFPQVPGGNTPSIVNLSYMQTVFNASSRGALRAAEARLAGQDAGIEQVRREVIAATASAYLELATVGQAIAARQSAADRAAQIVAITEARVRAGRELPAETIRAQLEAAQVRQSLVQLQGRKGIVEERLRTLIGSSESQPLVVETTALPEPPPASVDALVARAVEASPALRQAEQERQARQAALGGAKGASLPSVDVVGQYGLFGRFNNYDQFFQRFQRNNVNVGVEVQVPIFSAQTSAAAALAASQLAEAEAAVAQARQALITNVRDRAQDVTASTAALDVARLQASLATETARETTARAQAGLANQRDAARAQLKAGETHVAQLDVALAADQARLALWVLTGQIDQLAH